MAALSEESNFSPSFFSTPSIADAYTTRRFRVPDVLLETIRPELDRLSAEYDLEVHVRSR